MDEAITAPDDRQSRMPRGGRGQDGSVFKRGKGYTIIYRANGKQKWEGGFATKEAARKRLTAALSSIDGFKYVESKPILFEKFATDWMNHAKSELAPKTWASYQSALDNWILPRFGQAFLPHIRRSTVVEFKEKLVEARSRATKKRLSFKSVKRRLRPICRHPKRSRKRSTSYQPFFRFYFSPVP